MNGWAPNSQHRQGCDPCSFLPSKHKYTEASIERQLLLLHGCHAYFALVFQVCWCILSLSRVIPSGFGLAVPTEFMGVCEMQNKEVEKRWQEYLDMVEDYWTEYRKQCDPDKREYRKRFHKRFHENGSAA